MENVPPLEPREVGDKIIYLPPGEWGVPVKEWRPTFRQIDTATTIGGQHQALSDTIIKVGAYKKALEQMPDPTVNKRFQYRTDEFEARFKFFNYGEVVLPKLVYLEAAVDNERTIKVAYHLPGKAHSNTSFAVLDTWGSIKGSKHEVYKIGSSHLSPVAWRLGQLMLKHLADQLSTKKLDENDRARLTNMAVLQEAKLTPFD